MGNQNTRDLNNQINTVINKHAGCIALSGKIAESVQFIARSEKEMYMNLDNNVLKALRMNADKKLLEIDQYIEQLRLLMDADGKKDLDNFLLKWKEYLNSFHKIRHLAAELNNTESNAEAYKISINEATTSAAEAIVMMDLIVKNNKAQLARIEIETDMLYADGKKKMLILFSVIILKVCCNIAGSS